MSPWFIAEPRSAPRVHVLLEQLCFAWVFTVCFVFITFSVPPQPFHPIGYPASLCCCFLEALLQGPLSCSRPGRPPWSLPHTPADASSRSFPASDPLFHGFRFPLGFHVGAVHPSSNFQKLGVKEVNFFEPLYISSIWMWSFWIEP